MQIYTITRKSIQNCLYFSFNHILIKLSIIVNYLFVSNREVCAQSTDEARLLELLGQTEYFIMADNFEQAAELREKALDSFKKLGKKNDERTIEGLHNILHAYSEKKMFNRSHILGWICFTKCTQLNYNEKVFINIIYLT